MADGTNETADVQEQQVALMTALAQRDVNVADIRGEEEVVHAELLDGKVDVEQVDRIASEFDYQLAYQEHYQQDGEDRVAVGFVYTCYDDSPIEFMV